MADKLPWIKFFPDNWLSDERLRLCSLSARGMWIDILCLMHKCDHRGYLEQANGRPLTHEQLSRLVGLSLAETGSLLRELIDSGVASVSGNGVIFNRRMVRDEHIRKVRADAGHLGGEKTGGLLKQKSSSQCFEELPKQKLKQNPSKGPSKPLASIPLDSSSKEEGLGGSGEGKERVRREAKELANDWVSRLTRYKSGYPGDALEDMVLEFGELLRPDGPYRLNADQIRVEIMRPDRDRAEQWFRCKDRLTANGKKKSAFVFKDTV